MQSRKYLKKFRFTGTLTSSCMLAAYFEVIQQHIFRKLTFIILRRCDDGKKDQVCCLKDGADDVVSTASTTTSNPLPTLYCYDISGSNDRGG